MNLSLLIGPDRFTCLIYFEQKIIRLSIFELENEPDLLKTILDYLEAENVSINKAESITLSVIKAEEKLKYTVQLSQVKQYFERNYTTVQFKDTIETMLQAFKLKYPQKSAVFTYWQPGKIYFWTLTYGAVDHHTFHYFRTAEDALYYVLHFYKLNHLSTEKDTLYLSGALSKDSTIFNLLRNYFANIEFVSSVAKFQFKTEEELTEHLFFDILSAHS